MQVLYNILLTWVVVGVVLATISTTFLNLNVDKAAKYFNSGNSVTDEAFTKVYLKRKMYYDKQPMFMKIVDWCLCVVVLPLLLGFAIFMVIVSGIQSVIKKKGGGV